MSCGRGWAWAHPRSRGENHLSASAFTSAKGSSPLTRGKRMLPSWKGPEDRLIPAHAGKTGPDRAAGLGPAAHPRSRGENARAALVPRAKTGSSPLTRGKLAGAVVVRLNRGLIPAHAGKTEATLARRVANAAHPRSRGENTSSPPPRRAARGSSPLTRGKRLNRVAVLVDQGLIPAHAGKTATQRCSIPCAQAHPRSRGENGLCTKPITERNGSSPLTRGKPKQTNTIYAVTPAHPRSRGENTS